MKIVDKGNKTLERLRSPFPPDSRFLFRNARLRVNIFNTRRIQPQYKAIKYFEAQAKEVLFPSPIFRPSK